MIGAPSVYMGHEAATHQCLYRKPLGGANLCSFDAARFFDSGCTERREASSRVDLLHYIFILAAKFRKELFQSSEHKLSLIHI